MSWTRRWGIIGFVAVAQLGVVVCYQAMLTGGPPPVSAQTVVVKEPEQQPSSIPDAESQFPPPPGIPGMPVPTVNRSNVPMPGITTPPIPVPVNPQAIECTQEPPLPGALPPMVKDSVPLTPFGNPPMPGAEPLMPGFPGLLPVSAQVGQEVTQHMPVQVPPPPMPNPGANLPDDFSGLAPRVPAPPMPIPSSNAPMYPGAVPIPMDGREEGRREREKKEPIYPAGVPMPMDGFKPPMPSSQPPKFVEQPQPTPACPWNLNVEIVDGRTQLTAMNGKEVKFTVSCDKLDVQTPSGSILAAGKVKLSSDNIEGTCTQLTITWKDDVVVLDQAELKCKLDGQEAELKGQQLRLRLSRVVSVEVNNVNDRTQMFSFFTGSGWR